MTGRLSHEKEIAAYRIAQESLNNALKHSQSKMVELSLSSDAEYMYLSVQDNGGGIDTQAPKDSRSGNGLRNMHERARLVHGKLYIDSVKNKGTKVLVEIPID